MLLRNNLFSFVTVIFLAAGCSTIKAGAHEIGAYDYPKPYKANKQVSEQEGWRALFEVKPAAEDVVQRAVNLARTRAQAGQEENNEFLALAKLDLNHDRIITASEANESAGMMIQEVASAMGDDLRIDDGLKSAAAPPSTAAARH